MKVRANMINVEVSRATEIEKMTGLFKLSLVFDLFDDLHLSNTSLFRGKDKMIMKGFKNHFKAKFKMTTEELFDLELKLGVDILDPMKEKMEAVMDEVLEKELSFDKIK